MVARGREIYGIECRSCHGPDLRGGERGGPNLLRSQVALNDQSGDLIVPAIQNLHKAHMPDAKLTADDMTATAAFIRSVLASAPGQGAPPPGPPVVLNVLVGDARAGEKYFAAKCASCHSVTGDLEGDRCARSAGRSASELMGGRRARARRRTGPQAGADDHAARSACEGHRWASGQTFEGRLERIDDFNVVLTQADGTQRSFRRTGAGPKVEVRDPLEPHRMMLPLYTDKDIHDVTAYLASVK